MILSMQQKKNHFKIFLAAAIGFFASALLYGYGKFQQAQALFAETNESPASCPLDNDKTAAAQQVSVEQTGDNQKNADLFISCGGFF